MEGLNVKIISQRDKDNGEGLVDEDPSKVIICEDTEVGIIENGTAGGQIVIAVSNKLPDGRVVVCRMTENHFNALQSIVKGAKDRFLIEQQIYKNKDKEDDNEG